MEYRSLGRTGVLVSSLCLGAMNFGSPTSEEDSMRSSSGPGRRGSILLILPMFKMPEKVNELLAGH